MEKTIILLGPIGSGKSTISLRIAEKLDIPCYSIDKIKNYYYYKHGYDALKAFQIEQAEGLAGRAAYNKKYDILVLKSVLNEFETGVIDLGAGQCYYLDPMLHNEAGEILDAFPNRFLLLPTDDNEENIRVLDKVIRQRRFPEGHTEELINLNRKYIRSRAANQLAKHLIFTHHKTIEEVSSEIVKKLKP